MLSIPNFPLALMPVLVQMFDSGHMVPMNQPKASLEMLRRFVSGEPVAQPEIGSSLADI